MSPAEEKQTPVHASEVKQQQLIADEVETTKSVRDVVEDARITLRSKNVNAYPLTVSVVGSDDLIFDGPGVTVEVAPKVAEQITYSPTVEVVE